MSDFGAVAAMSDAISSKNSCNGIAARFNDRFSCGDDPIVD
jgi:hypothetical protein